MRTLAWLCAILAIVAGVGGLWLQETHWILILLIASALFLFYVSFAFFRAAELIGIATGKMKLLANGEQNMDLLSSRGYAGLYELQTLAEELNRVRDSLREVTRQADVISTGDYSANIQPRSANDTLGKALYEMTKTLRKVTSTCNAIAQGDLSAMFPSKGDSDLLAKALNSMVGQLALQKADDARHLWTAAAKASLADAIRGELGAEEIANRALLQIAKDVEADVGAIYLAEPEKGLVLAAGYALMEDSKVFKRSFAIGEGLVGQVAAEARLIEHSDIPEDVLLIHCGLGVMRPKSIVACPWLQVGSRVRAVVVLASSQGFRSEHLEYLTSLSEALAISILGAENRERVVSMLEETQRQAEELQSQQEELRQMNEELEEQTQSLRQSEEELRSQHEEMQTINEELSEKTSALHAQNGELDAQKNQLLAKSEELERANRYKSEFLANMSHELRSPLNSLLLLAQNLSDNEGGNLTADQVESARIILTSGHDLLTLVNDILDLAKIEAGRVEAHPEAVRFSDLFEGLERIFKPLAQNKKLRFECRCSEALPASLESDAQRLAQILRNFLSNAFKFSREGAIRLEISRPTDNIPLLEGVKPEDTLVFAVTDEGIGIPKESQERIFEAFHQVDSSMTREYSGTGLGLAISRELALLLGGKIHLKSEPGKGSTFRLILPQKWNGSRGKNKPASVSPATAHLKLGESGALRSSGKSGMSLDSSAGLASSGMAGMSLGSPAGMASSGNAGISLASPAGMELGPQTEKNKPTVLIIEDDVRYSAWLQECVQQKGFEVIVADTGEAGLRMVQELSPVAILLDLGLPGMSGREVLDELKKSPRTRSIPVQIISCQDEDSDILRRGAFSFLTKPLTREQLSVALDRLLASSVRQNFRLLLVEDDSILRVALEKVMAKNQLEIQSTGSGEEALAWLRNQHFDCLVLDMRLADMSGFDLLRRMEDDPVYALIPVIVHTGRDFSVEEEAELRLYTKGIIIKGANSIDRLLDEIMLFLNRPDRRTVVDQRRSLAPSKVCDNFNGQKILVVDDDMRNTFAMAKILRKVGLEVVLAENGQKAIAALNQDPGIQLVLMDIMMPVMDGYTAMREIRKDDRFKKLPILALTAKAMQGDREKSLEAGASDYLSKPVDVEKLMSMLRVWMYGR